LIYFFKILSKFSIKKLYILSSIFNQLSYYFFPYRKKIIWKNLKKAFPNKPNDKLKDLEKKFYSNFINVIIETIKLLDFCEEDLKKRIKIINPEIIKRKNKNPIIIISGHYGNWEWLLAYICIFWKKNIYAIYKPLSSSFFNNLILKIRTKFGAKMLRKSQAGKFILTNLKKENMYFILADQVPENLNNSHKLSFLKLKTSFSTGVERLSLKTNANVFYAEMKKIKKGFYNIELHEINNNITGNYVKKLEKTILEAPENWLWSHNRWKR